MVMRYYDYLSEAKVEMLYPQIDQSSKVVSREVGVDVRLLKVSRKIDGTRGPSIYEKLSAVEDWIYAHEPVGNVDEPEAWIYGRMSLAETIVAPMVPVGGLGEDYTVFYAGKSDSGAYILLGGSARHLNAVSSQTTPVFDVRRSSSRYAIENILRHFPDSEDPKTFADLRTSQYTSAARFILRDAPLSEYEFLAKRLVTDSDNNVSLATPLFVAQAN